MSKATQNGKAICPCAGWCREVDENMREAAHGREELEHANICDGTGKAITSDSEMVKILRARLLEARNETRKERQERQDLESLVGKLKIPCMKDAKRQRRGIN